MPEALTDRLSLHLERVRAHVALENRRDLAGVLRTFGTAVAYEDQAWRERYPGEAGIRAYYEDFFRACDDLTIAVHREYASTDAVILELTISGTHAGAWHGLPATGRRVEFPLCAIYTFDAEDRLAGERIYYDRATVFAQLGVYRDPARLTGRLAMLMNHPLTFALALSRRLRKRQA